MALPSLAARLEAAELAYYKLMVEGQARVIVDQNGERVEFTTLNATRLLAYITQLKAEIAGTATKGPLKVWMQ